MKKYVIIAGVNGAGKSTLYQLNNNLKTMLRVNVDEIIRKIGDWKNSRVFVKPSVLLLRNISLNI